VFRVPPDCPASLPRSHNSRADLGAGGVRTCGANPMALPPALPKSGGSPRALSGGKGARASSSLRQFLRKARGFSDAAIRSEGTQSDSREAEFAKNRRLLRASTTFGAETLDSSARWIGVSTLDVPRRQSRCRRRRATGRRLREHSLDIRSTNVARGFVQAIRTERPLTLPPIRYGMD
jgi:hypothetical protein